MGYQEAMEAAGANILDFEQFGSYQGDWYARVEYAGREFFVAGSYGSCSGCDSFEAEFGYNDENKPDYQTRLAEFGRGYLEDPRELPQLIAEQEKNLEWDSDAKDTIAWLRKFENAPSV